MHAQTPQVIRFGSFEIDVGAGELRKNGVKLKIQGQLFRVLLLLLERHNQLVTREELRRYIWSDDTFVGFDNGLNRSMARLRELLGDSADAPRYIETLARKGYRFIFPVEELETRLPRVDPLEITTSKIGANPDARKRRVYWVVAVLATVIAMSVYLSVNYSRRRMRLDGGRVTLVVLPFENLTGDPRQDYFSDGLTEEMITQLGGLAPDSLGVIARTSAMHYKGTIERAGQIGRELNVDYLLEGSVRREGTRVRISAQLIRVRDETHLWAQDYDRDVGHYLELESEIARNIANQIELKLSEGVSTRSRTILNPDAYEAYLKGRYFWNQRSEKAYLTAIRYFEQAIAEDPGCTQAHAGLADAYALLGSNPTTALSRREAMRRARAAASAALIIDDTVAEAHTSLAFIYWHYDWNWPAAEKEFHRALELNPSYPTAHHWFAFYLMSLGRMNQAVEEIRRAQQADPLSLIINTDVGEILFHNQQYVEAIAQERRTLEMNSDFPLAWGILALSYTQVHDYAKAIDALRSGMKAPGGEVLLMGTLGVTYALMRQDRLARAVLHRLTEKAERSHTEELYLSIAEIYSALGNKDQAFLWLEKDYRNRDGGLTLIKVTPPFDSLHSDPRFADLVRRMGLPP